MNDSLAYVMDGSAVLEYGSHVALGQIIATAATTERTIAVPVLCLAAGYRVSGAGERLYLLDALASQPCVTVTPVNADDGPILGGWASVLGSFGLAHAVMEAATHHVPLITADRDAVTRILPKEWPIIDL